jgi:hypothetical protein
MNDSQLKTLLALSEKKLTADTAEVVQIWRILKDLANELLLNAGFSVVSVKAMHTKFNDAGRRSAPWKSFSSKVPGRPQDGSDGNRINRWLMPLEHKFYASEKDATLVQIRYYLQTLSMIGAPELPLKDLKASFQWLTGHLIEPGLYEDPIQLVQLEIEPFLKAPRSLTSGHLIPLDRGGKHVPENAYLMLHRSNQLQGNMTLDELVDLMKRIVERHAQRAVKGTKIGQ